MTDKDLNKELGCDLIRRLEKVKWVFLPIVELIEIMFTDRSMRVSWVLVEVDKMGYYYFSFAKILARIVRRTPLQTRKYRKIKEKSNKT